VERQLASVVTSGTAAGSSTNAAAGIHQQLITQLFMQHGYCPPSMSPINYQISVFV